MVLFIHHRYRVAGGEERAVENLVWLVREHLGEEAELLTRDSAAVRPGAAAAGLLGGGLHPEAVAAAVRRSRARIVHAHNLQPTLGWRSLAAARAAGARVVLHLHQYRLVCAIGVCFRDGHECLECHGTNTLPGIVHNCRGSRAEAVSYGASLALWQRRLLAQADAVVVPSAFAAGRLRELGVELPDAHVVPNLVREFPADPPPASAREGALVAARLAPEKGVDVAIDACARAGIALTIAGDGPERINLERRAAASGGDIRFLGQVDDHTLADLRARSAVAVVASRSAETFGLAAAEAMAAGLPVAASRIGALPELIPDGWLATPGDTGAFTAVIRALAGDPAAGELAVRRAREHTAPEVVGGMLQRVYAAATA